MGETEVEKLIFAPPMEKQFSNDGRNYKGTSEELWHEIFRFLYKTKQK